MKSYVDPPNVVHTIWQTLLTFFCSLSEDKLGDWNECKQVSFFFLEEFIMCEFFFSWLLLIF